MIRIPLRRKYRRSSFKGLQRKKSDDQPGKATRTGRGGLTRTVVPNKGNRKPRGQTGTPQGKCLLSVGKEAVVKGELRCRCGGHLRQARERGL